MQQGTFFIAQRENICRCKRLCGECDSIQGGLWKINRLI